MSASSAACQLKAWRQHQGEIRHFLTHHAGNPADADDLGQEVFLKALLQGENFCRIDNPRAWLFHVARNLLSDRWRLIKAHLPLPDELCAEAGAQTAPVDVLSQCLPRVLGELSAEDRAAITLCDLEGVSQREYAERHALSLAAAKSRVQRARQRLQQRLVAACQVKFDETGQVCCFVARPAPGAGSESR